MALIKSIKKIRIIILPILFLFVALQAQAELNVEFKKVEFLIRSVSRVDAKFIRNNKVYSGKEAAAHMRMKFKRAQGSIFAPDRSQWTAKMFIDKVASKSSFSGQPYLIAYPDGRTVKAKVYLKKKLKQFQ